jgi:uncharacterized membrane protein
LYFTSWQGLYYGRWLPTVIFGVVAVIASFLTLLLPETLNQRLPDTVDDVEGTHKQETDNHDFDNLAMEKDTYDAKDNIDTNYVDPTLKVACL